MNLKQISRKRKLTQRDISVRTGIAESTISRAFRGGTVLRTTLQVICGVLDVKLEEVTGVKIRGEEAAQTAKEKHG